jgi:hypothetical protein
LHRNELEDLAAAPHSAWGKLVLPPALTNEPTVGSHRFNQLDAAWTLVEPLIQVFKHETNLSRQAFTALIRRHAEETGASQSTLLRTVLRYYYFGGTRLALLPLPPGAKPGTASYKKASTTDQEPERRRGRQSVLAAEFGRNNFIVREEDIQDMLACFKRLLAKGPAFKTTAHEDYLATEFRRRHPGIYDQYVAKNLQEPVTARQFRYYVDEHLRVNDALANNIRTYQRNPGYQGSLSAIGPGEIYEIDSTGGRLHLVSSDNPPVYVGKPTIYFLIDRWSRFVVSAYLSLRSPSYEEVRHTLLIAFTSREGRFNRLGVNITDERWPIGHMPAVICPDRGSDFMSDDMAQSVVNDLRIDVTPLPPLCPDGKAIVERLIREVKRKMATSGFKGVYADRPLDPITKRASRNAEAGAVHTLTDAYRLLIDIVEDHNNRPHRTLRRRRVLTQAGISPTPRSAYLWGLKNITGLRSAPLSEDDYHRLLLSTDKASVANGVLSYKNRPYLPADESASELARHSTTRAKAIAIRLDKTLPTEVFVPNGQGAWARFQITQGAANEIDKMSLDEEEALSGRTSLLWARAEHEGRIARVTAKNEKRNNPRKGVNGTTKLPKIDQIAARNQETARMKESLHGKPRPEAPEHSTDAAISSTSNWVRMEEEERLRNLALIRKHRNQH